MIPVTTARPTTAPGRAAVGRRAFVAGATVALLTAFEAAAQSPPRVPRIGFLRAGPPPKAFVDAFEQGLRELGYVLGRDVVIDYRLTEGGFDQLSRLAEELVRLKVDVILASAGPSARAAVRATTSVPIVFVGVFDPVETGLVPNLAHPGGNVTGLSISASNLAGKRLQLLQEIVPRLKRVAVLSNPGNPFNGLQLKGARAAAVTLGLQLHEVPIDEPKDFEHAFKAAQRASAMLQLEGPLFTTHEARLAELAMKSRLPAIHAFRSYVEKGGLISYGTNTPDLYRRAASLVARILKGAKPGDLPVEQPATFELAVNMKTAKAIGVTIPRSLLVRADRVIE